MSLLTRAKELTGGFADTSKRQAQRGKLEIEIRRLEGKIGTEKTAIGDVLFPLLEAGTVSAPGVDEHVTALRALLDEVDAKRAEIDELRAGGDDDASGDTMGRAATGTDADTETTTDETESSENKS